MWTYEGELLGSLIGHTSFIFSSKCLEFGKYISVGEDK